jgi:hypothetical protein
MTTNWVNRIRKGVLLTGLVAAGLGLNGCADEYAAYPGYRGGYYASYASAPSPYYGGYGYGYPYRAYGPYYGRPYYGYGSPYYGGSTVVVSRNRSSYTNRGRFDRWHNRRQISRNTNRAQTPSRATRSRANQSRQSDNDEEGRYYTPR